MGMGSSFRGSILAAADPLPPAEDPFAERNETVEDYVGTCIGAAGTQSGTSGQKNFSEDWILAVTLSIL